MVWLLVLAVYQAPPDAVDWDGPWKIGMTRVVDAPYHSEAECRNSAVELIGKLHQGMLAPVRYKCVEVPADLPKGAPR
jgi:hypothetical protein